MKRARVTLTDIAEGCGVSRATVSLVLRRSPLVHTETRKRIEQEMQRQGYVYNRGAANLRRQVSSAVALVINDLSNPFFAEFAAGVDEALGEHDHVTLLGCSNESPQRQQQILASLMEYHPAAIILSPAEGSALSEIRAGIGAGTPLLVFNRTLSAVEDTEALEHDFLGLDNRAGARMATEHLLARGHRRIAFFGGHAESSSCRDRRAGYRDALQAAGLAVEPHWMVESAPTRLDAYAQTGALFASEPAPTAAVCYNDAVALGLIQGLARNGHQAGIDFAVTGFDDIPEAMASMPPLTTISAQPRERGRQAAQIVLQRAQLHSAAATTIAPVRLVERESTPHA